MIEIDGSYGEGGGQIIRTAIALSAVTGKPCRILNIRKGRTNPGLQAQHLTGVEAATKLCNAELKGAKLHSTEIEFIPKEIKGGKYKFDIGTAGSISLVLQTLIPACLHADKETELEIIGGTVGSWAPSIIYFQQIFCNFLEILGMKREEDFFLETTKHGFYPKGGGRIVFRIKPFRNLKKIHLVERGKLKRFDAWSVSSKHLEKSRVAERQIESAEKTLGKIEKKNVVYDNTLSIGTLLHLHAHYDNCKLGADVIGEREKSAEKVGEECGLLLKRQIDSQACFDRWMADQTLPYLALAGGGKVSVSEITNHCKTNIWVIEKFLPVKFEINKNEIECLAI